MPKQTLSAGQTIDNWVRFSVKDADYGSDARIALSAAMCFMPNASIAEMAEHYRREIELIDATSDSDRIACADYRRQFAKIYNLCREHLTIRQGQRRFRGELPPLLDFCPLVRDLSD